MKRIIKFVITGFPRTGTTYLAALLNSQKNIVCIESNLETHNLVKNSYKIKSKRDLNILCTEFESHFTYNGFNPPNFRNFDNIIDIKETYYNELKKIFKSDFIGTKSTRIGFDEIKNLNKENIKVIVTVRNSKEIIKSAYNKFENSTLIDLAIDLKDYKKDLNNFKLIENKNILLINLNEFIDNQRSLFKILSKFLKVEIKKPKKLYYSWNKNRGDGSFFINSSFGSKNNIDLKYSKIDKSISDYANYADNNKISINLIFPLLFKKFNNILKKIGRFFLFKY